MVLISTIVERQEKGKERQGERDEQIDIQIDGLDREEIERKKIERERERE